MIIAAVADTHGDTRAVIKTLAAIKLDHLLFAGDYYRDGQMIARILNVPAHIVAGNCDAAHQGRREEIVTLLNHDILLVHGHQYGVKRDLNRLYYRAREADVNAVVFGHTHYPYCENTGGLWMINPGSPVKPRLQGHGSFALIDINERGLTARIVAMDSD
ncbi:MAG: YfcE family phosphodiesterase [Syntrophomonadaceae bacterium]|nr:YfcE family phosphodiesterase [Syntrophomonadaceae bacterium]